MINDRMGRSVPAAPALLLLDSYAILTAILTHDCITSSRVSRRETKRRKTHRFVKRIIATYAEITGRAALSAEIDLVIEGTKPERLP
jgi:hypothetical protein